jgi:hypothetical protein
MHVTHGICACIDVAFCVTCKDNGPIVYRTVMRRLAEEERKIHELRRMAAELAADRERES